MASGADCSYFPHQMTSLTIAATVISISCVLDIPLFPTRRNDNWVSNITMVIICFATDFLLFVELLRAKVFQDLPSALKKWALRVRAKCKGGTDATEQPLLQDGVDQSIQPGNYLAFFFFTGYMFLESWRILNDVWFIFVAPQCFSVIDLVEHIIKMGLGILILISVAFQEKLGKRQASPLLYYTWSIAGATCFSVAFNYVVEEVVWAYVHIIEKSIHDQHYGLYIPDNITSVVDYIEPMFKLQAFCLEHSMGAESNAVMFFLELVPFSTEYFSFATFFCFVVWSDLGKDPAKPAAENFEPVEPAMNGLALSPLPSEASEKDVGYPNVNPNLQQQHHTSSTPVGIKLFFLLVSVVGLLGTVGVFLAVYPYHEDVVAIWIFHAQRIVLQIVGAGAQCYLDLRVLTKFTPLSIPPKFKLDIVLLLFPLFPLGIILTLRACPDIMELTPAFFSPRFLQTALNISVALVTWLLFAYQVIFIFGVLSRLHQGNKMSAVPNIKQWFYGLFFSNLCIWISWTLECKSVTLHSGSSRMYGVVTWSVLVYATVPFVLFGFAHTAAFFLEIIHFLEHT